jgi:hypothetical protein
MCARDGSRLFGESECPQCLDSLRDRRTTDFDIRDKMLDLQREALRRADFFQSRIIRKSVGILYKADRRSYR